MKLNFFIIMAAHTGGEKKDITNANVLVRKNIIVGWCNLICAYEILLKFTIHRKTSINPNKI